MCRSGSSGEQRVKMAKLGGSWKRPLGRKTDSNVRGHHEGLFRTFKWGSQRCRWDFTLFFGLLEVGNGETGAGDGGNVENKAAGV